MSEHKKSKENGPSEYYDFYVQKERPEEHFGDPLSFYTAEEIKNYSQSKSLMRTQEKITNRALF